MQDAIYYAYFAPYSYERHQDLIAKSISSKHVRLEVLGETLDGHDIDLLQIGEKLMYQANTSSLDLKSRQNEPATSSITPTLIYSILS